MHEHEAPGQRVSVLHLADDRLRHQRREQRAPHEEDARRLPATAQEQGAEREHADPEHRRDAHVPVHRLGDAEPEALDVLVRPGMRPGCGRHGTRDDESGAQRQPQPDDGAT